MMTVFGGVAARIEDGSAEMSNLRNIGLIK